ncbi:MULTISPECIES: DUF3854 domain-containing protein [Cyanophyceae]|uniref:DUF3854 domain-containing protein n=1 Tax=Cyanophyceae TaxID=3028117 RepID=UPI001686F49D|nr:MULTISPECIES: DUF3854 domain-containing protein [Cyanophyceae]MBD1918905.1 DUF3854 domain-containing protein [Phormidium sp. FACHB-77]MBD2033253.1 DUF3854 domain-containing protein [Phormidium sp. FACHB-322]MBD2053814.1 DUF3854 domain-containing protein [Leptolyngbya sp. FACHB-60]
MTAIAHPNWLTEFTDLGISPDLATANVRWIEGEDGTLEFLESTIAARAPRVQGQSFITAENARLIKAYSHINTGGWVAYGVTLDGQEGAVPYLKPLQPRRDEQRDRLVKYETPPGLQATPLLPDLSPAWSRIVRMWGLIVAPGESLWEAVLRSKNCPIAIVEGFKKALALVQAGIPAIALRGVTQWHPAGSPELWPDLWALAQGRSVYIGYDEDDRAATASAVSKQETQLSNALARAGAEPWHLTWDGRRGKGIDDYLASCEGMGSAIFDLMADAFTPKQAQRAAAIKQARAILETKPPSAARQTEGEYLPTLPKLRPGALHWVAAGMGSGKTVRIGRDWVKAWVAAGGVVAVLDPLNSLGQQAAAEWELPHLHDYGMDATSQQALSMDIRHRGGVVACLNSAHRILALLPKDAPLLLVIDEAAQTLTDAAEGGTLKGEWANRWEDTVTLMRRAISQKGAIVLAEDGLDQDTIDLARTLSGAELVIGVQHRRIQAPWDCTLFQGTPLSAFRGDLLKALKGNKNKNQPGQRIMFVTTSQAEARRLATVCETLGIDVERVDSTTNEGGRYRELFETPEPWLYKRLPQLLILTTSGKTGLSIEGGITREGAYFDAVWGYFPTLDTDTHKQLLGRYRPPVPRVMWAPAYISPEPGESAKRWAVVNELGKVQAQWAAKAGFEVAPADPDDEALKGYLAARRARRWAQKVNPAQALASALTAAGHLVDLVKDGVSGNPAITEEWKEVKDILARQDADYHAALELDSTQTPEWAAKVNRSGEATYEQRCKAVKVMTALKFPGMDWNSSDLWYAAIFCPRHEPTKDSASRSPLAPGASLWAEADHVPQLWESDSDDARVILEQRLKAAHLLPAKALKAQLAAILKPLAEQLLKRGVVAPDCPVVAQLAQVARHYAADLRRYWRLNCTGEQSDVAIANKVLRKLGLQLERAGKVFWDGKRQWVYGVLADPIWQALTAARTAALAAGTNLLIPSVKQVCPSLSPPGSAHPDRQNLPDRSPPSGEATPEQGVAA